MSWVAYLNFLSMGKYLCWLKSELSLISLLSFEMLFDCVISWLYMCVLHLTLGKLFSAIVPQFSAFSMQSIRTASLCVRRGVAQTAGWYSCTSRRSRLRRLDGKVRHSDAHDLSVCFRGSTGPDGVNKPSGRGHHRLYKSPWPPHFHPTPPKISLLAFSEWFLTSFWLYLTLSCHFVH